MNLLQIITMPLLLFFLLVMGAGCGEEKQKSTAVGQAIIDTVKDSEKNVDNAMLKMQEKEVAEKKKKLFVPIPAGCFQMGTVNGGGSNEKPAHEVCLGAFLMDKYEVTQEMFETALGKNPSGFKGAQRPVEKVTWYEAKEYCLKVGKRLPTEAEWEYAARAGTTTYYHWGDGRDDNYAWHNRNSDKKTQNVGNKLPNAWGLYDMSGNVWEWVEDWYDKDYYKHSPKENPKGPLTGTRKAIRGGSWLYTPAHLRTALRGGGEPPTTRQSNFGFRCVSSKLK